MTAAELTLRHARLVSPEGIAEGDLQIRDGKVVGFGKAKETAAEVDAGGLLVLPGMVDVHIHFMDPAEPAREDWPTGSAAAAVAGVTTVIEHTHAQPVRTRADLVAKRAYVAGRSVVDFGLGAHFSLDRVEDSLEVLEEGAAFIKVFTCETHGIPAVGTGRFYELMQRIGPARGRFLVHAEDDALTAKTEEQLKKAGREDGAVIPEWRLPLAEEIAADTVGRLALSTGAAVTVAHCSHTAVVDNLAGYRDRGAHLAVETCPQYLFLMRDEIEKEMGFRKFTPPARARSEAELEEMWERVRDGRVSYLASDHAPATHEQKTGSIWKVPFGLPGVDTTLRLLLDAVLRGTLSWTRLVELYAQTPARLYGLYPQKGSLQAGSDADFVLVDPDAEYTLTDEMIHSKAGWTPYAGRQLRGRVVATYLRGRKIAENQRCLAPPGTGRFLPGPGARTA